MLEDRLLRLLDAEQLSSSKFSDAIGVQRSSVSHILSGRNKPSFDFLQKTLKAFPYLNADWLILGNGKMYNTEDVSTGGTLFDQPDAMTDVSNSSPEEKAIIQENQLGLSPLESQDTKQSSQETDVLSSQEEKQGIAPVVKFADKKQLKRVILLYDDNSFETFDQGG